MALVWPETLQQCPLVDGFNHAHQDNLVRFQTDTGPGKVRPKASHSPIDVSCSIVCDDAQKQTLLNFYEDSARYGAFRFIWVGLDNAVDGRGHAYQFNEPPQFRPFGIEWKVDLQFNAWTPSGDNAVTLKLIAQGLTLRQATSTTFYANFETQTYVVEQ